MKSPHQQEVMYFCSPGHEVTSEDLASILFMDEAAGPIKGDTGICGLRLDFNAGLRLAVPAGNWHICICDGESELVFFDQDVSDKVLISMEKYYIPWHIEVWCEGDLVFVHDFDVSGQQVYFDLKDVPLGTGIMLLEAMGEFSREYGCQVNCRVSNGFGELVSTYYPTFQRQSAVTEDTYAVFYLGAYQIPPFVIPESARELSWEYVGRNLLHLWHKPAYVHFFPTSKRLVKEPYVVIAVQASDVYKCWLYPDGWEILTKYLKEKGYRVLCIDREAVVTEGRYRVEKPEAAEDYTGNISLLERINLLAYADFFIGMSSGLAWLANSANCPVVMISGASLPITEFDTPYRVTNRQVCHGCYNDLRVEWFRQFCPYHHGTDREMECSKKISPRQVILAVERLLNECRKGKHDCTE